MFTKSVLVFAVVLYKAVLLYASIEGSETNTVPEVREIKNFSNTERTGRTLHKECNGSLNAKCIKIHVLSFLEDLSSRDELSLLPGLSIVRESKANSSSAEEIAAEISRQFPGKPDEKLNRFLLYRLQDYLDNHSLRYRLLDPKTTKDALNMAKGDTASVGRKGGGGGGGFGGGKGGGGGALVAAALMMKGTLAAAALGALALLAGKALMTALMSLLLSALVGLKGGGGGKSTTYEIITKPEVSHHHSHSHEEHHEHEHGHHVKLNTTKSIVSGPFESNDTQELSDQIDNTVDNFFENHLIRFSALGKDVILPHTVETFVGRKKRKGGGGHGGGDDGGKKKMFMMAMMCMKMKMMMMVPAMMGMMGMMSFKGMMFSMMSFMMTKLMLLMKLLEKKGGGTTSWSSGGDAGWASSGGAGAWMPAGTADYGSGGYDSNGQWQSRSIIEMLRDEKIKPKMVYKPIPYLKADNAYLNDVKPKLRKRRSIIDTLHNAYMYWITKFLGTQKQNPKFKVINGVKYVYQPNKLSKRIPKLNKNNLKQLVITEEFNKGEISEPTNGRMIRRKFNKMKKNVKEAVDENPWE
ncbi:unnamed protein product [Leptosia nina]|uniref:Uncharacterized protein n=1 Tax=Leptosia nina TaxID=320188 RepID=A0AAV1IV71_9NEOP